MDYIPTVWAYKQLKSKYEENKETFTNGNAGLGLAGLILLVLMITIPLLSLYLFTKCNGKRENWPLFGHVLLYVIFGPCYIPCYLFLYGGIMGKCHGIKN